MARPQFVGGRLAIAESIRGDAAALRELDDADLAADLERVAEAVTQRGRDEITREFPLPLPERKDS